MKASATHLAYAGKVLDFIKKNDRFLLSSHMNADGDAIGSVIAIRLFLKKLNKKSVMIFHDQTLDQRFNYLADFDRILHYSKNLDYSSQLDRIESAIILDVPGYKRLGNISHLLPEKSKIVKIDHHPVEDILGNIDWVDEEASSTTQLVFEIMDIAGIDIDLDLANAIFTGIVYDTGRFSFSNTTARDYFIGSKMVEAGARPSDITNRIFFENSFAALKTIGRGLCSLETHLDGLVNIIYLSFEEVNQGRQNEVEELANYSVAIRGGKIGLFIREVKPRYHKISFRSKCQIDVNQIAKAFDGGGHACAAGCRIKGEKNKVIRLILEEIKKQL